jgi:hypothetical protein
MDVLGGVDFRSQDDHLAPLLIFNMRFVFDNRCPGDPKTTIPAGN